MGASYVYLWEYEVPPEQADAFERAYGPEGTWVQLFRKATGHLRTELHRDRERPGRYLTIDYWESEAAWRVFRERFAAAFEELDRECAALTLEEVEIGRFEPRG